MRNAADNEQISKIASVNGIDVYHLKTRKFKTNTINIFFQDNLNKENVTKNALLPAVLRRGTEKLPSSREISLYLEELYGAVFDCGVVKKGERQIIQFYIEYIADKYTGEKTNLLEKTFELLLDIVTKPFLENGYFKNEYMLQEKENLKKLIEGRANDKVQYSVDKCFEEMCREEPYGIYEYGSISDLDGISGPELYEHYRSFIRKLPMQIYITGDIPGDRIDALLEMLSGIERGAAGKADMGFTERKVEKVRNIEEKMMVNQGKLSLGFRTNTAPSNPDYYALLVCNSILGGGMHSKLFQNVREKESLAYYAFSRLDKFKGLMVISSGIEIQNRDKAQDIILKQLEEIKSGSISDYEYDSTIKIIETGIKSLKDSQLQMVDFYLSQAITGTKDDFESIIGKVKKVSKQDVVKVAQKIQLDTIYFLTAEDRK